MRLFLIDKLPCRPTGRAFLPPKLEFIVHAVGADAHIGPFPILWFDTAKLKPIGAKIRKILLIKVKFHRRADVGIGPYDGKTVR